MSLPILGSASSHLSLKPPSGTRFALVQPYGAALLSGAATRSGRAGVNNELSPVNQKILSVRRRGLRYHFNSSPRQAQYTPALPLTIVLRATRAVFARILLWLFTVTVVVAFSFWTVRFSPEIAEEFLDGETTLATLTLLSVAWAAVRFAGQRHVVSKQVTQPLNRIVDASFTLAALVLLACAIQFAAGNPWGTTTHWAFRVLEGVALALPPLAFIWVTTSYWILSRAKRSRHLLRKDVPPTQSGGQLRATAGDQLPAEEAIFAILTDLDPEQRKAAMSDCERVVGRNGT